MGKPNKKWASRKVVRIFVVVLVCALPARVGSEIIPSGGLFDGGVSYYRYFVSKKLMANYYRKYCLFAVIPSFDTPYVVFIADGSPGEYRVVYRSFEENPRNKMIDHMMRNELNPLADDNQVDFFRANDLTVFENSKPMGKQEALMHIDRCSGIKFSRKEKGITTLDGDIIFFSTYVNGGFLSGLVESEDSGIYSVSKYLMDYMSSP